MKAFSQAATLAKNSLYSSYPFLIFCTLTRDDMEPIYIVQNNEDVYWNDILYTRYPIDIDTLSTDDGKTLPNVTLKISNIFQIVQHEIQKYNGLCDAKVRIDVVYMENMVKVKGQVLRINVEPEETLLFQIVQTSYDENWITFTLGSSPQMAWRFPLAKYYSEYCPFVFGDIRCGATGERCSNTLATCKRLERFGGSPALSS